MLKLYLTSAPCAGKPISRDEKFESRSQTITWIIYSWDMGY